MKVIRASSFDKKLNKVKDKNMRLKIYKQIKKIIENPEIGKPMKNIRKDTREVYISPYRLSYKFEGKTIIFLDFYHKDKQ